MRTGKMSLNTGNIVESVVNGTNAFGYSELVLSGFLRVVTHPCIFEIPSTLESALQFVTQIRLASNAVCIAPGTMHRQIFTHCSQHIDAKGNWVELGQEGQQIQKHNEHIYCWTPKDLGK